MINYQKHIKKLTENDVGFNASCALAAVSGDKAFITKTDVDLSKLTDESFNVIDLSKSEADVKAEFDEKTAMLFSLLKKKDGGAVIISKPQYASVAAKQKDNIPPILDDMAQIVGPSLKYADSYSKVASKLTGGRTCALLPKGVLLATARTLDEAVIATLVAEKSCYCFVKSAKLGGAVAIKGFEAKIMRIVYKNKYSKTSVEANKED